jgi:hypothetical protein
MAVLGRVCNWHLAERRRGPNHINEYESDRASRGILAFFELFFRQSRQMFHSVPSPHNFLQRIDERNHLEGGTRLFWVLGGKLSEIFSACCWQIAGSAWGGRVKVSHL